MGILFIKYWKTNFILGARSAWRWMGPWGKFMDLIIAGIAGFIIGQNNVLKILETTLVVVFAIYGFISILFAMFIVPFQESVKQAREKESQKKSIEILRSKLFADWKGVSFDIWRPLGRNDGTIAGLQITNHKSGTITECQAKLIEAYYLENGKYLPYNAKNVMFPVVLQWAGNNVRERGEINIQKGDSAYVVLIYNELINSFSWDNLNCFFGGKGEKGFIEIHLFGTFDAVSLDTKKVFVKVSYNNNGISLDGVADEKPSI
jgi:hypothetical protein